MTKYATNREVIENDFRDNNYPTDRYFNFLHNKDLNDKLIRNSKLDRNREPFKAYVQYGKFGMKHTLSFDDKFALLNFLIDIMDSKEIELLGYSTISDKNIDTYTLID